MDLEGKPLPGPIPGKKAKPPKAPATPSHSSGASTLETVNGLLAQGFKPEQISEILKLQ